MVDVRTRSAATLHRHRRGADAERSNAASPWSTCWLPAPRRWRLPRSRRR